MQGIQPKARIQLLALALASLEQQLAALPDSGASATAEEWKSIVRALLASCSVAAARAWLGYVPPDLQAQAADVIARCQPGAANEVAQQCVL